MEPILAEVNADDVDVLVVHNCLRRNLQYPLREGGADHSIKRPSTSRRRRDDVRLCRVSAGTAFGAYAVSGLARVTQWVLRSPKPAVERQRRAPIISHHQDPGRASGQPRDVWRTASARRALDS